MSNKPELFSPPGSYIDYNSVDPNTGEILVRSSDSGLPLYFIDPAAPPPEPLASSVQELLGECAKIREQILAGMKAGYELHPGTKDNLIALAVGEIQGILFAPVARLFDSAVALDLAGSPPFPGEPATARDAVALLDLLIQWCQAKQQPSPAGPKRKLREPPQDAFKCYRLFLVTGKKQTQLAETLSRELHRPIDQSAVSRWLKQVKEWLEAGNVLPDLTAERGRKPKTIRMDPAKIDRGDGRKGATRRQRSADAEGGSELARLIAEQQSEDDYHFEPIQDDDD